MNERQKQALAMLVAQEDRGYLNGDGVVTMEVSALVDGQAWIHFQTARALERQGLIRIVDGYGDDYSTIYLEDAGRAVATGTETT